MPAGCVAGGEVWRATFLSSQRAFLSYGMLSPKDVCVPLCSAAPAHRSRGERLAAVTESLLLSFGERTCRGRAGRQAVAPLPLSLFASADITL